MLRSVPSPLPVGREGHSDKVGGDKEGGAMALGEHRTAPHCTALQWLAVLMVARRAPYGRYGSAAVRAVAQWREMRWYVASKSGMVCGAISSLTRQKSG